jgi:hypothetical protein
MHYKFEDFSVKKLGSKVAVETRNSLSLIA